MKKLNLNQFAKFAATLVLEVERFNYDLIIDIATINDVIRKKEPTKFVWLIRKTGSYLIDANNTKFIRDVKEVFPNKLEIELTVCNEVVTIKKLK